MKAGNSGKGLEIPEGVGVRSAQVPPWLCHWGGGNSQNSLLLSERSDIVANFPR